MDTCDYVCFYNQPLFLHQVVHHLSISRDFQFHKIVLYLNMLKTSSSVTAT